MSDQPSPNETEDTMTVRETMAALKVSRQTIARMMDDGRLTNVAPIMPARIVQPVLFAREQVDPLRPHARPATPLAKNPRKPRKKREAAPPDVVTDYAVTAVYTPPTVAAVERLLTDTRAPYTPD